MKAGHTENKVGFQADQPLQVRLLGRPQINTPLKVLVTQLHPLSVGRQIRHTDRFDAQRHYQLCRQVIEGHDPHRIGRQAIGLTGDDGIRMSLATQCHRYQQNQP